MTLHIGSETPPKNWYTLVSHYAPVMIFLKNPHVFYELPSLWKTMRSGINCTTEIRRSFKIDPAYFTVRVLVALLICILIGWKADHSGANICNSNLNGLSVLNNWQVRGETTEYAKRAWFQPKKDSYSDSENKQGFEPCRESVQLATRPSTWVGHWFL